MLRTDNLVIGSKNNISVNGQDAIRFFNDQTSARPFRGQYADNNTVYDTASKADKALINLPFSAFVRTPILDPHILIFSLRPLRPTISPDATTPWMTVQAAWATVAETLEWYPNLPRELGTGRTTGISPKATKEYTGTCWGSPQLFKIVITPKDDQLCWEIQGPDLLRIVYDGKDGKSIDPLTWAHDGVSIELYDLIAIWMRQFESL
ncbi:beta-lactamase domain-containing protein [Apiospora kogelbergensis]|uniref:beta-lactamase domain-containing protein n=1 Tax=Apiospora kogelbergensis TaxID=1337665 RepID=UPI00312E97CA